MTLASVLPYRTDALALAEWLEARARGRSAEQLREAVESPKGVEGTAAAALALGFVDADGGRLTELGERFALGDEVDRRTLLAGVVRGFAPYAAVFAAIEARGSVAETEVRWIEAFWATRGFGSSASNRREGGAAFGRLSDFAGLGEYIPGRRGRPTRIRWVPGEAFSRTSPVATAPPVTAARSGAPAPDLFTLLPAAEPPPPTLSRHPPSPTGDGGRGGAGATDPRDRGGSRPEPQRAGSSGVRQRGETTVNRITIPLAGTTVARVEVPLRLPAAEKRRLLDLLALLIAEE